jgi:hypothetical protein
MVLFGRRMLQYGSPPVHVGFGEMVVGASVGAAVGFVGFVGTVGFVGFVGTVGSVGFVGAAVGSVGFVGCGSAVVFTLSPVLAPVLASKLENAFAFVKYNATNTIVVIVRAKIKLVLTQETK